MRKKLVLAIISTLVLVCISGVAFRVKRIEAGGTIYIRYDGSIEGTTDISTVDNVTYTFTDNINDSIVVERSHIIIDGAGYTLQGSGSENGFVLWGISNTTIRNADIKGFEVGVYIGSASKNIIFQNNITENYYGITLWSALNNSIVGNKISWNDHIGINVYGDSSHNTISGNNLTDNFYIAISAFGGSSNNDIIENNIVKNTYGINYGSSNYNTIIGNNITKNSYGIELYNSTHNSIHNNRFVNNTVQVRSRENSTNFWDNGSEGNYWSDYESRYPNATEVDGSSIWDTPYVIDENNQDNYPIIPEFPTWTSTLLLFILLTVVITIYKRRLPKTPIH